MTDSTERGSLDARITPADPIATSVPAPIGFVLPMSVGAILMSLSTVVVALNAQLLRRLELDPEHSARAVLER